MACAVLALEVERLEWALSGNPIAPSGRRKADGRGAVRARHGGDALSEPLSRRAAIVVSADSLPGILFNPCTESLEAGVANWPHLAACVHEAGDLVG